MACHQLISTWASADAAVPSSATAALAARTFALNDIPSSPSCNALCRKARGLSLASLLAAVPADGRRAGVTPSGGAVVVAVTRDPFVSLLLQSRYPEQSFSEVKRARALPGRTPVRIRA